MNEINYKNNFKLISPNIKTKKKLKCVYTSQQLVQPSDQICIDLLC